MFVGNSVIERMKSMGGRYTDRVNRGFLIRLLARIRISKWVVGTGLVDGSRRGAKKTGVRGCRLSSLD